MYDFDTPLSREGTSAEKYTARRRLFGREDILPFWVADMEFAAAPVIREALAARINHPVYGYTSVPESLVEAIIRWNNRRYSLSPARDSVTLVPGVMAAVSAAIDVLSEPGDAIVVQPPLYPPLMSTVLKNSRQMIENPLILRGGGYCMNFDELERLLKIHRPRIMLLCSPHNPVGRVWKREELVRLVELTEPYGVFVVSDEIHADIIFAPHRHISLLTIDEKMNNRIILLNSASKSFNVAGLNTAYAIIPDRKLRTSFRRQLRRWNLHGVNLLGMTALEAAYRDGEEWLEALLRYLHSNIQFMTGTLDRELPRLQYFTPEGTYLYWLNFNSLGLAPRQIREKLIDEAGVGLNDGVTFSQAAEGFWRFNFAAPRAMLEQGLERIVRVFS